MKKQSQTELDILALLTKIQEQLIALDKKMDSHILQQKFTNKPFVQPTPVPPMLKPSFPPSVNTQVQGSGRPNDQHKGRQMHRATCADCKKECEIPFKPTGDRPVYCKECFMRRKNSNSLKVTPNIQPKAAAPAPIVIHAPAHIPAPPVKEKKKSASAKQPAGKKKPVAKKKKK